jgi:hypothetical protein
MILLPIDKRARQRESGEEGVELQKILKGSRGEERGRKGKKRVERLARVRIGTIIKFQRALKNFHGEIEREEKEAEERERRIAMLFFLLFPAMRFEKTFLFLSFRSRNMNI